jgi:hypothetical protein
MAVCSSDELTDIRNHWGSAYEISLSHSQFIAARRDGQGVLTARSVAELWRLIREHTGAIPCPVICEAYPHGYGWPGLAQPTPPGCPPASPRPCTLDPHGLGIRRIRCHNRRCWHRWRRWHNPSCQDHQQVGYRKSETQYQRRQRACPPCSQTRRLRRLSNCFC